MRRRFIRLAVTFMVLAGPNITYAADGCEVAFRSSGPEVTYLQKLMDQYGDTPASIANLLGINESAVKHLVSTRSKLGAMQTAVLAGYFGVDMAEFAKNGHTHRSFTGEEADLLLSAEIISSFEARDGSTIHMRSASAQANVRRALMILAEQDPNPADPKVQVDLAIAVANTATKNNPSQILTRQELSALLKRQEFRIVK